MHKTLEYEGSSASKVQHDRHSAESTSKSCEKQLHRHFLRQQVNKVNPRKEFFRLDLGEIKQELDALGVQTHWTMMAQAREYRETLQIEQQILENPAIAAEWTRHQMEYEESAEDEVLSEG